MVTFINNNTFIYSLISNTEPSSTELSSIEFSMVKRSNVGNKSSNNKGKSATYFYNNSNNNNNPSDLLEFIVNIKNLSINIDFFDCYFNNDG